MKRVLLLAVACLLVCTATSLHAAFDCYLQIEGIQGSVVEKGFEGAVALSSFSWGVSQPASSHSGLATGKRQYEPIRFIKQIDKSSPILAKHCATGQHIPKAVLYVRRPNANGGLETYYKIEFEDCLITSVRAGVDLDSDGRSELVEEFTITFKKITWTWIDGGITAEDDWEAPTR